MVGDREVDDGTVAVRYRDDAVASHAAAAARAVADEDSADDSVVASLREAGILDGATGKTPVHTLPTSTVVALCDSMRQLELDAARSVAV